MQDAYLQGLLEGAVLLMLLLFKHFLADFPLQTKYMMRKSNAKNWQGPLLAHIALHGLFTVVVVLAMTSRWDLACLLGLADFCVHGLIDAVKARFARYHQFDKRYWIALGLDQYFHQVTYIAMVVYLLSP